MKKFTRLLSATIIAIMTMCLCSFNIFAAENLQIVIKNTNASMSIDRNTFSAYKILSATVNAEATAYVYSLDNSCVSSSGYGTGYSSVSEISAAVTDESSARTFADYVYNNYIKDNSVTAAASAIASGETATITVPTSGYYLVIGEGTDGNGNVITSLAMLGTSSDAKGVEIDLKATVPTIVEKVVREQGNTEWKDITDAEIGETVEFRVHSKVPDLTNYPSYIYKIVDDLSEGLTYKTGSVKVYSDTDCSNEITGLNVSVTENPNTTRLIVFDLSGDFLNLFKNGTLQKDGDIYLKYEATVNDLAKYAKSAAEDDQYNNNKAVVEYSKDLYESGTNGNAHATVNSVEKKAYVYTYGVEIDKIQPDGESGFKALAGAKFKIKKGEQVLKFTSVEVDSAPVYRLDPVGTVTELTGDPTNGKFIVYGLDVATTYTLEETAAPAGYAQLDKTIPFQITATYNYGSSTDQINTLIVGKGTGGESLTDSDVTFASDPLTVKVVNKAAGGQLIGTGGMGTTIFYVCGGIMMAGAVILLFTKIRMGNKD